MKRSLSIIGDLLKILIVVLPPFFLYFVPDNTKIVITWKTQYVAYIYFVALYFLVLFAFARDSSVQRRYIRSYKFDVGLKNRFAKKHPALTHEQIEKVFEGLRDFFYICHKENGYRISMPSKVVDDAWHEFILFTLEYKKFCQQAFGRFLHHTPAEAMKSPDHTQEGVRRAWRLACEKETINPRIPHRLPLLFALDTELGIADGFLYSLNCQPGDGHYCVNQISCGVEQKGGCRAEVNCGSCGCG